MFCVSILNFFIFLDVAGNHCTWRWNWIGGRRDNLEQPNFVIRFSRRWRRRRFVDSLSIRSARPCWLRLRHMYGGLRTSRTSWRQFVWRLRWFASIRIGTRWFQRNWWCYIESSQQSWCFVLWWKVCNDLSFSKLPSRIVITYICSVLIIPLIGDFCAWFWRTFFSILEIDDVCICQNQMV